MLIKEIANSEIDAYDESSKLKKRYVFDLKFKKIKTEKKAIKKEISTKFKIKLKKKEQIKHKKKKHTKYVVRILSLITLTIRIIIRFC